MSVRVQWSAEARSDLEEIERYVSQFSYGAADRLTDHIVSRARKLAAFPLQGRSVPEFGQLNFREVMVRGYRVIYQLAPDGIEVIAVFHASRDLSS